MTQIPTQMITARDFLALPEFGQGMAEAALGLPLANGGAQDTLKGNFLAYEFGRQFAIATGLSSPWEGRGRQRRISARALALWNEECRGGTFALKPPSPPASAQSLGL